MTYHTGWGSHRWSGWPGAICMLCGCEDPLESAENFPVPDDLSNPTQEEVAAHFAFYESIDKVIGNCPGNPDGDDPYSIPVPRKGDTQ